MWSVLVFKSAILRSRIRSSSFPRRFSSAKKSDVMEERLAPTGVADLCEETEATPNKQCTRDSLTGKMVALGPLLSRHHQKVETIKGTCINDIKQGRAQGPFVCTK